MGYNPWIDDCLNYKLKVVLHWDFFFESLGMKITNFCFETLIYCLYISLI